MADDTMVERVGDAILEEYAKGKTATEVARAAIAAMREPTQAMLDAGPVEPYMDRDVWAGMIDAALSDKTGTSE